jgi:hypothetical protein
MVTVPMFELSHGSFSTFHIIASASDILRSKRISRSAGPGIAPPLPGDQQLS